MKRRERSHLGGSFVRPLSAAFACVVAAMLFPGMASALTPDEVLARWQAAAGEITTLECDLEMHVRNRGAHGKLLQEFTQRRHLWCDKVNRRIRDRRENGPEDLWDGTMRKWKRWQDARVAQENLPDIISSVESLWPDPGYAVFPGLLIDPFEWELAIETSRSVKLVGRLRGAPREQLGQARVELDFDMARGVPLEVRTYARLGELEERVRFKRFKKAGDHWVPELIKIRRNRQRNVEDWDLRYTFVSVNRADPAAWDLP